MGDSSAGGGRIVVRLRSPEGEEVAVPLRGSDKVERLRCILQWCNPLARLPSELQQPIPLHPPNAKNFLVGARSFGRAAPLQLLSAFTTSAAFRTTSEGRLQAWLGMRAGCRFGNRHDATWLLLPRADPICMPSCAAGIRTTQTSAS